MNLKEAEMLLHDAVICQMPTKNPAVFNLAFACPVRGCEFEYESLVSSVGTKALMKMLCCSHIVAHARPIMT